MPFLSDLELDLELELALALELYRALSLSLSLSLSYLGVHCVGKVEEARRRDRSACLVSNAGL